MSDVLSVQEYRKKFRNNVVIAESGEPEMPEEWDYERDPGEEEFSAEELLLKQKQIVGVRPSEFVEFAIKVPDKENNTHVPFSFKERPYLRQIYDSPAKRLLLKCGRQVEKSTLLGNRSLSYACIIRAFNILYVSPANAQTKTFSQDRLREPIETSDELKAWTTTKLTDNVFLKKFLNRSQITLRYAFHNADRTRGIPADKILLDEIQDIITDNIPVIEQCAAHSPYRLFTYAGTPKSYDNALEKFWVDQSTQNEWVVPCHEHQARNGVGTSGIHWNILGEENIGAEGIVCELCGRRIAAFDPMSQWVSTNSIVRQKLSQPFEGYRIPQLMVPWIKWSELLDVQRTYPKHRFHNEVLGLSYDTGTRPLMRQDVIDNCWTPGRDTDPEIAMSPEALRKIKGLGDTVIKFAGIDWGTGEGTYTVLSLGAYIGGFFTIFYIHRFTGQETEPPVQLDIISKIIQGWNVDMIGVDYGGGFDRNDALKRRFGDRIVKYQYSQPGVKVKWEDGLRRYLVHRTEVMSDIFNAVKSRRVFRFPRWEHFEDPFAKDFLNIFSEYNEQQRQIQYKKSPDATDDAFHSVLLCFLVSILRIQRPDVLIPSAKTNGSDDPDDYEKQG